VRRQSAGLAARPGTRKLSMVGDHHALEGGFGDVDQVIELAADMRRFYAAASVNP
jgi:hypothetical protein